jgi:ABC-2 type transport system ATP-binding protein
MTSTPDPVIETSRLVKVFGETRALDGLDLAVPRGSVHCLLGPNGAGKTTTIKIMATLLRPDSGTARVLGHDVVRERHAIRRRIGLTGQVTSVDEELTGLQNLILAARLQGMPHLAARARAQELLAAFGLAEDGNRLLGTYSIGQRRRVDIAASLVVTPDLLFLDEPTTGLDPRSRSEVWSIVRSLVAEGGTVLLTTQYLDEADQLSDHITLIDHGRVVAEGTPAELKSGLARGVLNVGLRDPDQRPVAESILARSLGAPVRHDAGAARLSIPAPDSEHAARALGELTRHGVQISHFALDQPSLDEVFFALTGHSTEAVASSQEVPQ